MNALACTVFLTLLTALTLTPFPARAQGKPTNPAPAPTPSTTEFRFGGGSFHDFTRKLADHFDTNLLEIMDVRGEEAYHLRVPKMRHVFNASPTDSTDWSKILKLYNQISEEGDGFLGKWIFTPSQPWVGDGRCLPPQTLI